MNASAYLNRLWAYTEDNLIAQDANPVANKLNNIGSRIDQINELANKGTHDDISREDAMTALSLLVTVTYDLLLLRPPPYKISLHPYEKEYQAIIQDMLRRTNQYKKRK